MKPFSSVKSSTAEWIQPKTMERIYQLKAGDNLLATLSFRSGLGTLAVAETSGGKWSFKRVGFLNPRVTVRIAEALVDLAVYQPRFQGDGTLTFSDGAVFSWKPTNFWSTSWIFSDAVENVVLMFKPGLEKSKVKEIFKTQATVELGQPIPAGDRLPILATLGMYLVILYQADSAMTTAATTAASS